MRYLSVCSGIEAASVAWEPLGWTPVGFAEIDKFPSAVLTHHFPDVKNHGDFTRIQADDVGPVDLLVGGTPCQDNSKGYSAGSGRAGDGLDGARSGLAFDYVRLVERCDPRWIVWENVPNVLAARHSRGFLRFAADLTEIGFTLAWRLLDQRHFGSSDQPRQRLFVVGHRDPRCAAAVLLEPQGVEGNIPEKASAAPVLTARGGMAFDDRTPCILEDGCARIATPLEWERAMGFPDNWTRIPYRGKSADKCPDGPRYKAVGNSMAVNCMRWIGQRIDTIDKLTPAL